MIDRPGASKLRTLQMFAGFALGLRTFLRTPLTIAQAEASVRQQLCRREEAFLSIARDAVFRNPRSPYLALFRMAACEYGDLERLVRKEGLDGALTALADCGVWVGFDEFKGRKPIARGSWTHAPSAHDFDNPLSSGVVEASSGGATGQAVRTAYDFAHLTRARAAYKLLTLSAWRAYPYPVVMWSPLAPGYGPLEVLAHAKAGKIPLRWYTPVRASQAGGTPRDHILNTCLPLLSRLAGSPLPSPVFAGPEDAWKVTTAIEQLRDAHGGCTVLTDPSAAVRVCTDASDRSVSLQGVLFVVGGEPITGLKRKIIEETGAGCSPLYVFIEGGYVGIGCLSPHEADDMHVLSDTVALVQHDHYVEHAATSVRAFLATTLLRTAPKLLLNVQPGDYGVIEERACDCALGALGLTTHVSRVRSFDKLTSAGMTVMASYFLRLVEEVLPAQFGGSMLDYQFIEEESEDGASCVTLLISPELGLIDETAISQTVLNELGMEGKAGRMAEAVWTGSETVRIRRGRPAITARGKLLPLDIRR